MLQGGVLCKTGLKRKVNQDRAGMLADGDTCLCYIADGMGGHYAGEKASGLIAQSLTDWWDGCHEAARRMPLQELAEPARPEGSRRAVCCHPFSGNHPSTAKGRAAALPCPSRARRFTAVRRGRACPARNFAMPTVNGLNPSGLLRGHLP